ncbi:hypothetical protein TRFO_09372 [Tritrichomonas foetus]|uniref:Importin N-terminal domain-containing protein n=1 Tax=Tritrichomonas foetus TaxID=1144522 RepID=A0A1J4JEN0_9EUKA|nr:hypothetical protein TRFO_09372 [Tritrichomonas foetus]|eukprot:OHS97654.1 hypothetical protein TRFO_09372 [Tritrichomonas foetus]
MSLDDLIASCLQEFTNQNDTIRSHAEETFKTQLENQPNNVLPILFNIIKTHPTENTAFSALIQISSYISNYLPFNNNASKFEPSTIIFFRNQILQFFSDPTFPIIIHNYMLQIIIKFYILANCGVTPPFHEIWDLLNHLFQVPIFYSDSMFLYRQLMSNEKERILIIFDKPRIDFVLSHLNLDNQKDKVESLLFLIDFWKDQPQLFNQIPILETLHSFSSDSSLTQSCNFIVTLFLEGNFKNPLFAEAFLDFLFSKLVDDSNDELFRVFCLFQILNLVCKNHTICSIIKSILPKVINILCVISYDPYKYPDLYNQVKDFLIQINNFTDVLVNNQQMIIEYTNSENLYISSLFLTVLIHPTYLEKGLFFSSHENSLIRSNGLYFLKKLIKNCPKFMIESILPVGSHLLNVFNQYNDQYALSTFSKWCLLVPQQVLINVAPLIIQLCTKHLTTITIQTGATLCLVEKELFPDISHFAELLMKQIMHLVTSNPLLLSSLMNSIPFIMKVADPEKSAQFLNFVIPYICKDKDCLFSKGMNKICHMAGTHINIYSVPIFSSLYRVFGQSESNQTLSLVVKALSQYGVLFEELCNHQFKSLCHFCEIAYDNNSDYYKVIPINALRRFCEAFPDNEELYNIVFEDAFKFFMKEKYLLVIRSLLRLILILSESKFFSGEKIEFLINNFIPIIDYTHQVFGEIMESDISIDNFELQAIENIQAFFIQIFEVFIRKCPNEILNLTKLYLIDINRYKIDVFRHLLIRYWCEIITMDVSMQSDMNSHLVLELKTILTNNLFFILENFDMNCKIIALSGFQSIILGNFCNEEQILRLLNTIHKIIESPENSVYFNTAFTVYIHIVSLYGINTVNYLDFLENLLKFLPLCININLKAFENLMTIVDFCLTKEDCIAIIAPRLIGCLIEKIRSNVINTYVLKVFAAKNQNLNPILQPLIEEIRKALK